MFSAIKRFTSSKNEGSLVNVSTNSNKPPGLQTMSTSLQKKFARGVQYNSMYAINFKKLQSFFNTL